jgi:hypothetical protein
MEPKRLSSEKNDPKNSRNIDFLSADFPTLPSLISYIISEFSLQADCFHVEFSHKGLSLIVTSSLFPLLLQCEDPQTLTLVFYPFAPSDFFVQAIAAIKQHNLTALKPRRSRSKHGN